MAEGVIIYECDGLALGRVTEPYDWDQPHPVEVALGRELQPLVLLTKVDGSWRRVGTDDD